MFDSFSPLLHLNDQFLDDLNSTTTPSITDDDTDDWLKPLLFDQLFEHDFLSQSSLSETLDLKQDQRTMEEEKRKIFPYNPNYSFLFNDKYISNTFPSVPTQIHSIRENDSLEFFHSRPLEQQIPSTTTTTTTVRVIHQPKLEPAELPTTLFVSGNELQFHPIVTTNNSTTAKTIGHTYTSRNSLMKREEEEEDLIGFLLATTSSPLPSVPIVPARVLKGKKFKRGGRMTSRA